MTESMKSRALAMVAMLLISQISDAATKLPFIFTKNMVLQSGAPVPVWGTGTPGETVMVEFAGQTKSTEVTADGSWRVELAPMEPCSEERELKVSGAPAIPGVVVGDVWVCIGDQNMALAPQKGQPENTGGSPLVRHYVGRGGQSPVPLENFELPSFWAASADNAAGHFNPVAHGFAMAIHEKTGAPVGILNLATTKGGSLQSYLPAGAHKHLPEAGPTAALRSAMESVDASSPVGRARQSNFLEAVSQWKNDATARLAKQEFPLPPPKSPGADLDASQSYNALLHPIRTLPVKGVLFYHHSRTNDPVAATASQLKALVFGLREAFGRGDLPVFVAAYHDIGPKNQEPNRSGGAFAEAVRQLALTVPGTGAPTASDLGAPGSYAAHRPQELGRRFALLANRLVRGDTTAVASGPMLKSHAAQDGKIVLTFDEVGSGLESDGPLGGFAIAGGDKKFHWATATIVGNTVELTSPGVPTPLAAHYDTINFESGSRLRNKEGLPAHPFHIGVEP